MKVVHRTRQAVSIVLLSMVIWSHTAAAWPSPPISLEVEVNGNHVHFSWHSSVTVDNFIFFYAPFPDISPINAIDVGGMTEASVWLPSPSAFYVAIGAFGPDGNLLVSNTEYFRIRDIWRPAPGTSWQWQLSGPIDTDVDAEMFDVDLFDTPVETIRMLHDMGKVVICYFSAGTHEDWRPDAHLFPSEVTGNPLDDWPGERWLDIRRMDSLSPIMEGRLDLAVSKGCDGVEPDNVDGYENDSGFDISYEDQLQYNVWLAREAHKRGLSVGLKNDLGQVKELVHHYDWALNEECFTYGECGLLLPFIQQGKAVFGVEYELHLEQFCGVANAMNFDFLLKNWELDACRIPCR